MASFSIGQLMKRAVQTDEIFEGEHLTTSEVIERFPDGILIDDAYEFVNSLGEFVIAYGFSVNGKRYYAYAGEVLKRAFGEITKEHNKPLNECRSLIKNDPTFVKLFNDTAKNGRGFTNAIFKVE